MINITKFFLIKQVDFEMIITQFNLNLTQDDPIYLLTYITANIYAFLCIIATIWLVMWLVNSFFKTKVRL